MTDQEFKDIEEKFNKLDQLLDNLNKCVTRQHDKMVEYSKATQDVKEALKKFNDAHEVHNQVLENI